MWFDTILYMMVRNHAKKLQDSSRALQCQRYRDADNKHTIVPVDPSLIILHRPNTVSQEAQTKQKNRTYSVCKRQQASDTPAPGNLDKDPSNDPVEGEIVRYLCV